VTELLFCRAGTSGDLHYREAFSEFDERFWGFSMSAVFDGKRRIRFEKKKKKKKKKIRWLPPLPSKFFITRDLGPKSTGLWQKTNRRR